MQTLASLLCNIQATGLKNEVLLEEVLDGADDHTRAAVESGIELLHSQGLERAAEHLSRQMGLLMAQARRSLHVAQDEEILVD